MKYKHIASFTVSTKKGHTQDTRWAVWQSSPYPSLSKYHTWENDGGLNDRYETPQLEKEYVCALLRSDFAPETAKDNRTDYAGFNEGYKYEGGVRFNVPENPGTIVLRGCSLGELRLTIKPDWQYGTDIQVRGYGGSGSRFERDWITDNIKPHLLAYIKANEASLKTEATERLKASVESTLVDAERQLSKARETMMAKLAKL